MTSFAQRDRLLLVAEPLDGHDRAEHLVLDDLGALVRVGDDRRLVVGARAIRPGAAEHQLRLGLERPVDHALDLVGLGLRDERAHVEVVGVGRVAPLDRLHLVAERGDELVVDRGPGDHAAGRGAVLAGVPVARALEGLGRELDVGVVEHDDRRLAAELEVEPLDGARRRARRCACRSTVSPVIETIRTLGCETSMSPIAAPEPGQHVEHARRQLRPRPAPRTGARTAASGRTA